MKWMIFLRGAVCTGLLWLAAEVWPAQGQLPKESTPTKDGGNDKPAADSSATEEPRDLDQKLKKLKLDLLYLHSARAALAKEREAATKEREAMPTEATEDLTTLRLRLAELVTRLSKRLPAEPLDKGPVVQPTIPKLVKPPSQADLAIPEQPLDAIALGQTLFQNGDYESALKVFRQIDLTGVKGEERVPVQYLIGTCFRKLGKLDEATRVYREVANSRGDPFLAECAQWQLSSLRWQKEVEGQLQALRQKRQGLEKDKQ